MFILSNTFLPHLCCLSSPIPHPFPSDSLFYRVVSSIFLSPRDNAENMHFFSSLALTLNEPEEGVAPTDSRLRPDQRLMEAGLWDEANVQKQRLEECQRLERKKREVQANQALEEGENEETNKNKRNLKIEILPFTFKMTFTNLQHRCWFDYFRYVVNVCGWQVN